MQVVEAVAFVWDEYAEKVGADSQKVGDYTAATFQGKPAARRSASDMDLITRRILITPPSPRVQLQFDSPGSEGPGQRC